MRALIAVAALGGVAHAGSEGQASGDGLALVGITAGTRAGDGGGFVLGQSDWNSVSGLTLTGGAEIPVWRHLRAVLRIDDFAGNGRPGAGLAYVLAPYATAYVLYKAEGFSEPEGEVEGAIALARGPLAGSLTFGQDADAKNRDVEGAVAARFAIADRVFAGAMARYRDALGTTGEPLARDGLAGAVATIVVDRVAVSAVAGVAGVQKVGQRFEAGPAATLAISAAF
ncbi:MAG TPA: hypothetical protein VLT45_15230 [Kofleriaceae bacterium]|nr:hypothetical protein [Kofleriaceae bacterium]